MSSAHPLREQRRSPVGRVGGGQVWLATVAVTVATVVLQWLRVRDTFFVIDDFIFLGIARAEPFGLQLLRKPIFEHFSPALWTANKVEVGPLHANHGFALALGLAITAIGVALMHRLILRLTRSPAWALALSGLYGSSLFLTSILRWWTTSVHANLAATLSLGCLLAFCRFEEERRARDAWLSVVLLAGALLTHEKALLVPLYLGLLWLLVYQRGFAPGRLWTALRRELGLWIGYAVLWAASLANFLASYYQPRNRPPLRELAVFAWRSVFTTFLPVSFGMRLPQVGGSVGGAVQVLAVLGLLAAVVLTCRAALGTGRGWLFLAVAFGANLWVLGTARLPVFHTGVDRSLQWQLELAFLFPIGLGMVVRETRSGRERNVRSDDRPRWIVVALLLVVAVPYLWLSGRSNTVVRAEFNGGAFSRPFLAAIRKGVTDVRGSGSAPTLLDRPLPGTFAPDWMYPYNMLREYLPTFGLEARVGGHTAGGPIFAVDDDGSLHRYDLAPVVRPSLLVRIAGEPGTGGSMCARLGSPGAVFRATVPAAAALGPAPVLRLDYRADQPAQLDVVSPGPDGLLKELSYGQLPLGAADNEYQLLLKGPLASDHIDIGISGRQGGSFCVDGLALGSPVRIPG